jgi:hypothetical protein
MSAIDLDDAKQFLDVIHDADDGKLQILLDAAEDEAMQYMNRSDLIEFDSEQSSEGLPSSIKMGIFLLLQANYQASPDDIKKLREAAETKLNPYRLCIGV